MSLRRLGGPLPTRRLALVLAAVAALAAEPVAARSLNGFELASRTVDAAEIQHGGPPRDGIPALDAPPHVPAADAGWSDDEVVLGLAIGSEARAYPIAILVWHELVNDTLGGQPVLVSYCPLCATGASRERRGASPCRACSTGRTC